MAPSANVLPKMTVVLDMDETLIHSRFLEMSEAETVEMRQAEER
jgi:TFIIF-interacting CTD phosphatase-like protein